MSTLFSSIDCLKYLPFFTQNARRSFPGKRKKLWWKRKMKVPFFYTLDTPKVQHRTKRVKFIMYSHTRVNKFRLFFTTSTQKQFQRLCLQSNYLKKNNLFTFLFFLETRIEFVLYRNNFVPSKYFARQLLKLHGVLLQPKSVLCTKRNLTIKTFESISFPDFIFTRLFYLLKVRLLNHQVLFNYPWYYETDFVLLSCMLIQWPRPETMLLPFGLENDLQNQTLAYVYNKI